MECQLMKIYKRSNPGFTLVEIMVVIILLSLSFMVFLQALNTGKSVRVNSEIRTIQAVLLNSLQQEIRARKYDENNTLPWSQSLGPAANETTVTDFDDIDDFHQYTISSFSSYPAFSCSVAVNYVDASNGFHSPQSNPTSYKSVMVKISHKTQPALTDTMIISSGF